MRQFLLLSASISVFALAGCSTFFSDSKPETGKDTPAPSAEAISPSDKEAQEMAGVMGGEAVPETSVEEKTIPADPVAEPDTAGATAEPADTAAAEPIEGTPSDCPAVEVLPDTKSITYFDDPEGKPNGKMVASAALVDIRGGCDYAKDSVSVDIDMIMKGKITKYGRYEGREDLEAFMTFPYFVAIMGPDGKMIDKKIMATAMRFQPKVNDLDHAEKITQVIPLPSVAEGPKYTITIGFQLSRAQLDYNRGGSSDAKAAISKSSGKKAAPVKEPKKQESKPEEKTEAPAVKSDETKADEAKAETETKAEAAKATAAPEAAATAAPAPAATGSAPSKMKPILE